MEIEQFNSGLIKALSTQRIMQYQRWTNQRTIDALALYALNIAISRAFYSSLNTLETVTRNSINDRMTTVLGEKWFMRTDILKDEIQKKMVEQAFSRINVDIKSNEITNFQIVSNLSFGFWTSLFGPKSSHLWGPILHKVFDCETPLQRKNVAKPLNDLRNLRNRIAHYEAIIQLDLELLYQECRKLVGMISNEALVWTDSFCDFPFTHPGKKIIVNERVSPELELSKYRFESWFKS